MPKFLKERLVDRVESMVRTLLLGCVQQVVRVAQMVVVLGWSSLAVTSGRYSRARLAGVVLLAGCGQLVGGLGWGQDTLAPQADPRDLGLQISANVEPIPGNDMRVVVPDEDDQPVVGKLAFTSGDRKVVMLPSGRLTSVDEEAVTETDRPFEPLTQDQMAERLAAGKFSDFKIKKSRRYIFVYNSSDEFAEATKQILETMYPKLISYCKRQKLSVTEPEVPLVVLMFRTEQEFQQYREMPEGVIAYYNGISNRVVMYEMSDLVDVAPVIALKQSISTIAHEGVHQILHNIGVQQRLSRWPQWVSEGLPEFFSPTDVRRGFVWKGINEINDLRLWVLRQRLEAEVANLGSGELLRELISATDLDSEGYAAAWGLTYFLAKFRPRMFYAYLRDIESIGALERLDEGEHLQLFQEHFGDDLAKLEKEWLKAMVKLPAVDPVKNQPHYVIWLQIGAQVSAFVTSSPQAVQQYRRESLSTLSPQQQAAARFVVEVYATQDLAKRAVRTARP